MTKWKIKLSIFTLVGFLLAGFITHAQTVIKVGPQLGGDGTTPILRSTRTGAAVFQQASGRYSEAVIRGNVYGAQVSTAGVALSVAVNTTPSCTLWNPTGSGVNLRLLRTTVGYTSGTMGAGSIVYAINNNNTPTSPTGGTSVSPKNCLIGAANSSKGLFGFGQTVTGTPTIGEVLASSFAELATTANGFQTIVDEVDGRYIITPQNGISIAAVSTAGTSPTIFASFIWEEVTQGQE